MRVVWTLAATRGLLRAFDYLYELNPRAAMHLAESLFAAGDGLVNFPFRGRLVPKTNIREPVGVHTYVIPTRVETDTSAQQESSSFLKKKNQKTFAPLVGAPDTTGAY